MNAPLFKIKEFLDLNHNLNLAVCQFNLSKSVVLVGL